MDEIKILTQALEKANKSGVFNLQESSLIVGALSKVGTILEDLENSKGITKDPKGGK